MQILAEQLAEAERKHQAAMSALQQQYREAKLAHRFCSDTPAPSTHSSTASLHAHSAGSPPLSPSSSARTLSSSASQGTLQRLAPGELLPVPKLTANNVLRILATLEIPR